QFIGQLEDLKYAYRHDIRDRAAPHANFREKFEALNRVKLTNKEFDRLLLQIVRRDVFLASRSLRERDTFEREDGTPLHFELVSNQTDTYYFANNNDRHFTFNAEEQFLPVYKWAKEDNAKITHLDDSPSIYAVRNIVRCIDQNCGNGYVWHTTGSGKTLTSFKASTLLKENDKIDKCLFVVDRKDLDRQTREEFNRFQEGCVEENTHTGALVNRLLSDDYADKV